MTNILLIIFLVEFTILLYLKRKTIMTQQEAHDALLAKLTEVSQAINAAAGRVDAAIQAASGKATVDNTDLNTALDNIKNTADAIAATPPPTSPV
jgi:hypothetical protein